MTLQRRPLSALLLLVGPLGALYASGDAQAAVNVFWKFNAPDVTGSSLMKGQQGMVVVDDDPTNEVASVELRVSSDGGEEDLVLAESDAWLHGSAALSALPAKDAALTLTLYDKGSASLMTFSGTLAPDGAVSLDDGESTGSCEIATKLGCTVLVEYDVEVLAAEVFTSGKGYALTLSLAGADTYEVAYAAVVVSGGDKAEVDWDAVGSVWQAESTLEHSGVIDVKAKVLDGEGNAVENVKAELGEPWDDGGESVNALSVGSGTSVAVHRWGADRDTVPGEWSSSSAIYSVFSSGWTSTSYPTHAELEVAGGDTVTVPANSYQRVNISSGNLVIQDSTTTTFSDSSLSITSGNFKLNGASPSELASPLCSAGTCVLLVEAEKGYELSVTSYGTDPAKLPSKQDFDVVLYDKQGTKVASQSLNVEFETVVTAVFASELEISGDPIGGDASGSVRLLGAADETGRQATLSKGTFYGSFARDGDGDLGLGGYGTDDWATSEDSADAVLGGPVACGGAGCDGDWAPPVVAQRPPWWWRMPKTRFNLPPVRPHLSSESYGGRWRD